MVKKKIEITLINDYTKSVFPTKPFKPVIHNIIHHEHIPIHQLTVIVVDDEYLRKLHRQYLHKNIYTDVMTFRLEDKGQIEAEIYISLDRAKIHAKQYHVRLKDEFARLIIHGLLHLKGLDDRTETERNQMKVREDQLLKKYWY